MVIKMDKYEALKYYYNYDQFRNNQEEIIDSLINGFDTLAILSTGSGKSICFQIPALISDGLTIVITPLISLMQNQVLELKNKKISAQYITSEMEYMEINSILNEVKNGKIKLLYISPERLENERYCAILRQLDISYLIIDEAHCISVWGNDFRPSYKAIKTFISTLRKRPVIGAFTATANRKVIDDIINTLCMCDEQIYKSSFDRKNLHYSVFKVKNKMGFLLKFLLSHDELGIIYTLTRKESVTLYNKLKSLGFSVGVYHGGMDASEKEKNLLMFMKEEVKIMVATNAFGMGINKPNIRFIINYSIPLSMEDLSQQQGRCCRDGEEGVCVLLFNEEDIKTCEYFIKQTRCSDKLIQKELIKDKYKQLKSVIDYAVTKKCYRQMMLQYFGENAKNKCYNCLNCDKNNKRNKS